MTMHYDEAIAYIHGIYKRGKKDGLKRIAELLALMGNPQDALKFVHVAGTNGKGSVCVMLSNMLREAGLRVGLFSSPYIERFNERIQLNGAPVQDAQLAEATAAVAACAERMEIPPSEFELVTAIAVACFCRAGVDLVVWETGLGGLYDATNVVTTKVLAVITPIDYDHTRELGDTLTQIAAHKCGIIRPDTPVVTCHQPDEAMAVIRQTCAQQGARLYDAQEDAVTLVESSLAGQTFRYEGVQYTLGLLGRHQLQNAAIALRAATLLGTVGFVVDNAAAQRGLARTSWPGRFEVLERSPIVIADGGHNPQGLRAAVDTVREILPDKQLTVLLGVMADKALDEMLATLDAVAARYIATAPDYPRALTADKLGEMLAPFGKPVEVCDTVRAAVNRAAACALADENGAVLCVGTLYMIGEVRSAWRADGLRYRDRRRQQLRRLSKTFFDGREVMRAQSSAQIAQNLFALPAYTAAKTVFVFVGTARELDTCQIIDKALADGKRVCVPLCGKQGEMTAREIRARDELVAGAYGIPEPAAGSVVVPPDEIDFGVIPCAVCDAGLHRVGKGGGYYDRYLAGSRMLRVVLCPDALVQDYVPQEPHDQTMDYLITESGVFRNSPGEDYKSKKRDDR